MLLKRCSFNPHLILGIILFLSVSNTVAQSTDEENLLAKDSVVDSLTDFTIYPNPARERIMLSASEAIEGIRIFDAYGQLIKLTNGTGRRQMIVDISNFATGFYFITVNNSKTLKLSIP